MNPSSVRKPSVLGIFLCALTSASVGLASTLADPPHGACYRPENCETQEPREDTTDVDLDRTHRTALV